eukprot:6972338-Pyramimonas_sp.AAC.1
MTLICPEAFASRRRCSFDVHLNASGGPLSGESAFHGRSPWEHSAALFERVGGGPPDQHAA